MLESPAQAESNQDKALSRTERRLGLDSSENSGGRLGKTPEQGAWWERTVVSAEWQWRCKCLGNVLRIWDTEDTVMW